jgi:hypothetical protein
MKLKINEYSVLAVVGVVFILVSLLLTDGLDDFKSALRGVAYEGVVFASILTIALKYVESEAEVRRKDLQLKEKLQSRDSLLQVISILCEAYHSGGAFHWTKLIKSAPPFNSSFEAFKLMKREPKSDQQEMLRRKIFRNCCEQNGPIVLAHTPIAERISPNHLNVWVGICSNVSLAASNSVFTDVLLHEFEELVNEFLNLPVCVLD